jgi:hypothetical protein
MGTIELLGARASPAARLHLLSSPRTADGTNVYLVRHGGSAVLKISPPPYPNVIEEMIGKARLARQALGERLGSCIPVPIDQWNANGVSCGLFEQLVPISSNRLIRFAQRKRITPRVLQWLRDIAKLDRGPNPKASEYLNALAGCPFIPLQEAAEKALTEMNASALILRSTVMHGDLWLGNVMLDPSRVREFMIIDWGGSSVDGFAIFDLVKFAESAALTPRALRTELAAHADRLGCSLDQTRIYLIAALGYIWQNLNQFPPERFATMAKTNLRTLDAALR